MSIAMNSFSIREARHGDLHALVDVHVTAFNETYPGPRTPTHALREQQWRRLFEVKPQNWFCYVVEERAGKIIGFATGNTYEEGDLPYAGQLNKLYLLRSHHRLGLGRKLMSVMAQRFFDMGINSMLLFSEADNPSIGFYDALGGERLYDEQGNFHGGYGWSNITTLITENTPQ